MPQVQAIPHARGSLTLAKDPQISPTRHDFQDFQASRAPDDRYRTAPLAGIAFRMNQTTGVGPFYHDGRFKTLDEAVTFMWESYKKKNDSKDMLSDAEKRDLVAFLRAL